MKKLVRFLAIASLVSAFSQPIFAADQTTTTTSTTTASTDANAAAKAKAMSMSNLLQQLQKAGYIVKSAEYNKDDNQYKVEAIDKHGEKQTLEVNGTSGLTADQKKTPSEVPVAQAVKKLEKNGASVVSVTMDNDAYKVTVIDNKGNQKDVTINMQTGQVSA
ncbi:MAG: PepSY domain-containing protein [Gammaproteobacteria bacterium]|nr:PepSY domain-containing protein [Gammaproteobacteria bacterium]